MKMILFRMYSGFLLLIGLVHGSNIGCSRLIVSEGDTAILHVENITCRDREHLEFSSPQGYEHIIVRCLSERIDSSSLTCYFENDAYVCANNANVSFKFVPRTNNSEVTYNLSITISFATESKNGTYKLNSRGFLGDYEVCWNLYVFFLQPIPSGSLTEHGAVRLYPNPKLHFWENATAEWLFDGQSVKLRADMLVLDGYLWIPKLGRQLNGKNVTYRVATVGGLTKETKIVLDVVYGPDRPLVLEPDRIHYVLKSGETMPDVACVASCNPPCDVSWDKHSSKHVLHLGKVTETMTGEYTCRANGLNSTVTRSILLHVTDETDFKKLVATISSVQAITVLFLIVCGIWYCLRTKRVQFAGFVTSVRSYFTGVCARFSRRTGTDNGSETTEKRNVKHPVQATEIKEANTYEALDSKTRCASPTIDVFSHAQTENVDNQEVYENTAM